ncbi:unnamed protein product [Parajaminaea phylloscopi]
MAGILPTLTDNPVTRTVGSMVEKAKDTVVHESESEAHQLFRTHHGHSTHVPPASASAQQQAQKHNEKKHKIPGVEVGKSTGVIYIMDRAQANGFHYGHPEWSNMAQGAPEVGHIPGAADKPTTIDLAGMGEGVHEYAPTAGLPELRQAVADYYNREFDRKEGTKKKPYGVQNVCIVPGGRTGLSRVAAVLGQVNLGYSIPVYSAYEQMLSAFGGFVPIPNQTDEVHHYKLKPDQIRKEIRDRGLSVFLLSNPNNPTGNQMRDEELRELVNIGRESSCSLILDEFYSWYQLEGPIGKAVSAAEYVEDPDEDPVILIDGLTKNWRCPGWRVCWVVGPADLISAVSAAGSFLDGGASHPMQKLAIPMLEAQRVEQDRIALQKHFRVKRQHVLDRLSTMDLEVKVPPEASFYLWVNLKHLPAPINSGLVFAEELLREKAIVTPGLFFDINPKHRRNILDSPCETFIRFSFGPPLEELDRGLDAIQRLIAKAKRGDGDLGQDYKPSLGHASNLHSAPAAGS